MAFSLLFLGQATTLTQTFHVQVAKPPGLNHKQRRMKTCPPCQCSEISAGGERRIFKASYVYGSHKVFHIHWEHKCSTRRQLFMSSAPFAVDTLNVSVLGLFVNIYQKSYIKEGMVSQLKPAFSRFSVGFQNDFVLHNSIVIPLFLSPIYLAGCVGEPQKFLISICI